MLKKLSLVALALGLVLAGSVSRSAFAEDSPSTVYASISPMIQRMNLDPDSTYKNSITVYNPSSNRMKVKMHVEPYSVEDINYAPIYSVRNAYTQIASWVTFLDDEEFFIEPYNSVIVNYAIDVPKDAPGGGQYAVIFADCENANAGESVQAEASAGTILIARVNGETRLTGEIKNTKIPRFLLAPPVSATATFTNSGNVDADATMTLKIENYFSGELIYDGSSDPLEKTILPDTTRELTVSWANVPRLGVLKVTLNTEFMGDAEVKSRIVFVAPIWFLALIALIILVVIFRVLAKKREDRRTRANSRNSAGSSEKFNL